MTYERRPLRLSLFAIALGLASVLASLVFSAPARAAEDDEVVPPKVQAAVDKALKWMGANQKPDGTWPGTQNNSTAVPSLAVMAFMSRGHVPGQGQYGEVLNRSIDYVIESQQDDGLLSKHKNGNAVMYEHGISAAMLSEAFGMVDDTRKRKIEKALAKAVQLIIEAQRVQKDQKNTGGWRYQKSSRDSDISVSGWQLMALRGAANCGATVPKENLVAGREYMRRCSVPIPEGVKDPVGGFAYMPGQGPNAPRTGTGILAIELLGEHGTREAKAGGEFLLKNMPESVHSEYYYYAVYYVSQALYQLGDKYWETGYPKMRDALLAAQTDSGVWAAGNNNSEEAAGPAYRTSMAVLALCVPYRYLPLYQK